MVNKQNNYADLTLMLKESASSQLVLKRPELGKYGLNTNALIVAKMYNLKNNTDYDIDFIIEATQNCGNAEGIMQQADALSQLIIAGNNQGIDELKKLRPEKRANKKTKIKENTIENIQEALNNEK
jgi:hypothetical protein